MWSNSIYRADAYRVMLKAALEQTEQDADDANILQHLHDACEFIHNHIEDGNAVLVHCQAGISRSATVCMAYLMRHHHLSLVAAYGVVKAARGVFEAIAAVGEEAIMNRGLDQICALNLTSLSAFEIHVYPPYNNVVLPDVTTLSLGFSFRIVNHNNVSIAVYTSDGYEIELLTRHGGTATFACILTNGAWERNSWHTKK